ncbi:Rib/alpha-like domain-containing protein [Leuconostoc lactis]
MLVIVVNYPDDSSDEVSVQLTVQFHASIYGPIRKDQTVKIGLGPIREN